MATRKKKKKSAKKTAKKTVKKPTEHQLWLKRERDHVKTLIRLTERYVTKDGSGLDLFFIEQVGKLKQDLRNLK